MSRKAKPIDLLLRLKQIKPDLEFEGADARTSDIVYTFPIRAYQEFLDEQAEASLLEALKEEKKTKKARKKTVKKVKQTVDPEIVETGAVEFNEAIDTNIKEEIPTEESN